MCECGRARALRRQHCSPTTIGELHCSLRPHYSLRISRDSRCLLPMTVAEECYAAWRRRSTADGLSAVNPGRLKLGQLVHSFQALSLVTDLSTLPWLVCQTAIPFVLYFTGCAAV